MSFPAYFWADMTFHSHRFHYWYVVNALSHVEDTAEDPTEAYYDVYSDY